MNRNNWKLAALLLLFAAVLILTGQTIGGLSGAAVASLLAVVVCGSLYLRSDTLVLRMSGARQLAPDEIPWLTQMVSDLAERAQVPTPALYLLDSPTPNAFATGRTPARGVVAVTTGITQLLTREELAGVIAHELAHIKHRDTRISAIVATIAGGLTACCTLGRWTLFTDIRAQTVAPRRPVPIGLAYLMFLLVAPIALALVRSGISRSSEYDADAGGASILGDPLPLASALEKIDWAIHQMPMSSNPGTAPLYFVNPVRCESGLLRFFSPYPETDKRIARLRALTHHSSSLPMSPLI